MKRFSMIFTVALLASGALLSARGRADGFYKDLFMDSGVKLNTYTDLPAACVLNLSMERISTQEGNTKTAPTPYESALMKAVFAGSPMDNNGILLYPDGSPRFKAIYVNGGKSTAHGQSITKEGLENIRTFYANGGSYVGTCAGAYFCSRGPVRKAGPFDNEWYLGIWPGYAVYTGLSKSATGLSVEDGSPLLRYYDFGGDMTIDSVRHNGGCYISDKNLPEGTEVLLRYIGDTLKLKKSIHKTINAWAYKASEKSGRLVVTGSHPERMASGDRLQMFTAMFRYALEGQGAVRIKGSLSSGEARRMDKFTPDNDPDFTAIGDRQYHHFTIDVPEGASSLKIDLCSVSGRNDFDLFLYAAADGPAFNDNARWFNVNTGIGKSLVIDRPSAGRMFISVFCATTVDAVDTVYGEQYCGRTDVLNGVPYVITATVK